MRDHVRLAVAAQQVRELPIEGHHSSAVLLLLHEHEGAEHVLFQLRTETVGRHSGQIGLPGGRRDTGDASLLATALRETHEEIGVSEADIEVFGPLDDALTGPTNFHIRPYAGAIRHGAGNGYAAAPREVREVLRFPLEHLWSPEAETIVVVDRDGTVEATVGYQYGEHVIWGATARILARFIEVTRPASDLRPPPPSAGEGWGGGASPDGHVLDHRPSPQSAGAHA